MRLGCNLCAAGVKPRRFQLGSCLATVSWAAIRPDTPRTAAATYLGYAVALTMGLTESENGLIKQEKCGSLPGGVVTLPTGSWHFPMKVRVRFTRPVCVLHGPFTSYTATVKLRMGRLQHACRAGDLHLVRRVSALQAADKRAAGFSRAPHGGDASAGHHAGARRYRFRRDW